MKNVIFQMRTFWILQIFLIVTFFLFNFLIFSPIKLVYSNPYTNIDVIVANNMITNSSFPNLIILDVRTQNEYDDKHLKDSLLIPVEELESRIDELSQFKDFEVIVYCRTGRRSAAASEILDANNFTKVFNVLGGITAWESADYPIIPEFSEMTMFVTLVIMASVVLILKRKKEKK